MRFGIGRRRRNALRTGTDPRIPASVRTGVERGALQSVKVATVLDLDGGDADFDILASPVPALNRGDIRAMTKRLIGADVVTQSLTGDGVITLAPAAGANLAIGVWVRWAYPLTSALPGQLALSLAGVDDGGNTVQFPVLLKPNKMTGGALIIAGRIIQATGLPIGQPISTRFAPPTNATLTINGGVALATYTATLVTRGTTQFESLYSGIIQKGE